MLKDGLTNNVIKSKFSISKISNRIKGLLENNLGVVKVKREISEFEIATSGDGYFLFNMRVLDKETVT